MTWHHATVVPPVRDDVMGPSADHVLPPRRHRRSGRAIAGAGHWTRPARVQPYLMPVQRPCCARQLAEEQRRSRRSRRSARPELGAAATETHSRAAAGSGPPPGRAVSDARVERDATVRVTGRPHPGRMRPAAAPAVTFSDPHKARGRIRRLVRRLF